jgi:hypothetical protein
VKVDTEKVLSAAGGDRLNREYFSRVRVKILSIVILGYKFPTRGDSQRRDYNNLRSLGFAHLAQALAHAMSSK